MVELQMNQLSLRHNMLKFEDFKKITQHFRGIYGIYVN